ncbi:DUF4843 domain-containing protein [Chitinophaga tropicalis]|uniref:DUF4843 domain-containing protein n=1 Tax=Chitinophaga tropicalis TaxID=2683588 RepID=A0A7K1U3C2_9BACT|nr:DUF4843 domain-containing protein [Chitinophaga tropicalis]MVT08810.1 DUF4843 domain-containing protein [Chitinophaga tropicalis]
MKSILRYISTALLVVLLLGSCKKDIMTYGSEDSVYFTEDSTNYTFVDKKSSVITDTVIVRVKLIGKLSEKDRTLNVTVDSGDAVEGKDYTVLKPVVLQKDSNFVSVKVVLNRTTDLLTKNKKIWLGLKNSDDIKAADFPPHTQHKLTFSDKVEKPDWWDSYFYLFNYSDTRMRFYIDVMGSTLAPNQYTGGVGLDFSVVIYLLKAATIEYNQTHTEPLSDEYGPINWDVSWIDG